MSNLPTFAQLAKALDKNTEKLNPSQLHGLVTGILCGKEEDFNQGPEFITEINIPLVSKKMLGHLFSATQQQLKDFLFEFKMILPSDKTLLPERAEALTLWCQGFLTGLKLTDVSIEDRTPSESTEAINDLIEIAKMNYESTVANEEDESAYIELIEYVRVAVILLYQELHEAEGTPPFVKQPPLH